MVKSHFKYLPHDIMYMLFKTYCMPLYGCPLWDYSTKTIDKFYVSWRKSIRYILDIPRTTHCALLNEICNDMPIHLQLYLRFTNFFKQLKSSNNALTNTCANLALMGSNSVASSNITIISNYLHIKRFNIINVNKFIYTLMPEFLTKHL